MRRKAEIVLLSICSSILVWILLSFFDVNAHNMTDQNYEIWNCFPIFFEDSNDETKFISLYYEMEKEAIRPKEEQAKPTPKKKNRSDKGEINDNDVLSLARIIHAENGGHEDDEALLLTGIVVLKRVKSKHYPDTIMGVISQKGQYSTYADGKFWNEPSKRSMRIAKKLLSTDVSDNYPDNLVFQAEFKQGRTVYKKLGYEYFCLA